MKDNRLSIFFEIHYILFIFLIIFLFIGRKNYDTLPKKLRYLPEKITIPTRKNYDTYPKKLRYFSALQCIIIIKQIGVCRDD